MDNDEEAEARRLGAMRHLMERRQFAESLSIARNAPVGISTLVGAQAAITVLIGLGATYLSPWPHLVGYAGLGSLVALFGRFASRSERRVIVGASVLVQTAVVLVMSMTIALGAPEAVQLMVLACVCFGVVLFANSLRIGPPGPLVFVFAAGASMVPLSSWEEVWQRTAAAAVVGVLALVVCLLTDGFRSAPATRSEPPRPLRNRMIAAGRIALAALIAALATHAAGAAHPAWAALGCVSVMQGVHLHVSMNRALQRMAGTILGAGIVWLVLSAEPNVWTLILLIAALQLLTEMVIGYNYAFGQTFVTPMALLMSYLAASGTQGPAMALERIADTLIGAIIGMIVAVVLSSIDDRVYLARHAHKTR